MMTTTEIKNNIRNSVADFSSGSLTDKSIRLFTELGYNTERQNPFSQKTFRFFKESFLDGNTRFNEAKALVSEWKYIYLFFQLSDQEITKQATLFESIKVVT